MTMAVELPQIGRTGSAGIAKRLAGITKIVASGLSRALSAADKAALPGRNLAELRAMYVQRPDT